MILKVEKYKENKKCYFYFEDCDNFATLKVLFLLNGVEVQYEICQTCFNDLNNYFEIEIKKNSRWISFPLEREFCMIKNCGSLGEYCYQENTHFWYYCKKHFNELGENNV